MSLFDSVMWDLEDYAERTLDVAKAAARLMVVVTRVFPVTVGIVLICLSAFGFWMESGSAPLTVPQQVVKYAKAGGTGYWVMQENGAGSGFLASGFGDKKEEADFHAALRFCQAHKGFDGCTKVVKAANEQTYGL